MGHRSNVTSYDQLIFKITSLFPFPFQVSTWFANARRRLKKENKMTWEPKNKLDDEDVDVSDDDDKDRDDDKNGKLLFFVHLLVNKCDDKCDDQPQKP